MNQNNIALPANYAAIPEEEMAYLDGGAQVIPTITSIVAGIPSFFVEFGRVMWDWAKSSARSFVEITMDDLRNPNFQGALIVTSLLGIISFLL